MSFPRKEERTRCYAARDDYWACLDQVPGQDEKAADLRCASTKASFEKECPAQWVTHFVRKYRYLKFKEKMDSGYDPVEENGSEEKKTRTQK